MGNLLVRKIDDEVVRRLKRRAAENRRSVEAEVRAILERELRPIVTGAALWDRLKAPEPLPRNFDSLISHGKPNPAEFE
jgi:plasmid stability protein